MWCELQDSMSTMNYCETHSFENPIHHLHHHHMHHDFPHFSQNHQQCFEGQTVEDNSAFRAYENEQRMYGQFENDQQQNWNNENYCSHSLDKSPCCPPPPSSASPNLPTDAQIEKAKIFKEISEECEHLLVRGECTKCTIRDERGEEQAIPISDLIEIVYKTAQSIKDEPGDTVVLSKKREQNKVAAAKYRDRQKTRWQNMQNERETLEKRNKNLKFSVEKLQKEVDEMRRKILENKI